MRSALLYWDRLPSNVSSKTEKSITICGQEKIRKIVKNGSPIFLKLGFSSSRLVSGGYDRLSPLHGVKLC